MTAAIPVSFSYYPKDAGGKEQYFHTQMPQVPRKGETVHLPLSGDPEDSIATTVFHVSWVRDTVDVGITKVHVWHAEVALS